MRETIFVSNKREKAIFVLAGALIAFGIGFFTAPFILQSIYGLKPGDAGYSNYVNELGEPNTPYQDFIVNGCLKEKNVGQDTLILDTAGLDELGMFYYDPNTCFDIAKAMNGQYDMKVQTFADDHMIITLTKKK